MKDILRLLIIALVGYGLYTAFLSREVEAPEDLDESGTAGRCIQRLDRAGDRTEKAILKNASSVDIQAWRSEHEGLQQQVSVAKAACNCRGDACIRGREALGRLRSLIQAMHDEHTSVGEPLNGAADRLETFRRTWEAAKALDR